MQYKIANCIFGSNSMFENYPSLLVKTVSGGWNYISDDAAIFKDGEFNFLTYFNGLSISKWRKYSVSKDYFLHIEYRGSAFALWQCCAGTYDWVARNVEGSKMSIAASDDWCTLDVRLCASEDEIIHGFAIKIEGDVLIRRAFYYVDVDSSRLRDVELAVATTTFRKEDYIKKNIELIKNEILSADEPIADHFTLHVIDNGRSLSQEELSGDHILIHPNANVGGSGGFAYGMMLAMEQLPKATHVLLMDDDVSVLPESFIRTYNLLRLTKDEYFESFLSGAMMSLEEPNLRTEDLGYFSSSGNFMPLKPAGYMTNLHDVVETEAFSAPTDSWADTSQQYAGWWYCVIPVHTIGEKGLPLPLFVRSDDAEYSLRCKPKFMTMNGICVWHNEFRYKYSSAVERYQVSRNTLICQAVTGMAPMSDFLKEIHHEVQLDLKKFNYDDAALAVKGLEDFLRGPEFIMNPVAEGRFMDANKEREKLLPLGELTERAKDYGVDLNQISDWALNCDDPRSRSEAVKDFATFNGQRLFDESKMRRGKVAVIDAAGWVYPAGKIHGADTIIAIDMANKKGVIRHYDRARFKEIWNRYKKAAKSFKATKKKLYDEYASYRDEMTSIAFWKRYLSEAMRQSSSL